METKVFLAKLEHLHGMLDFLKSYCKAHEIPAQLIPQVILAAEEALVNIISYGYADISNGSLELSCENAVRPGIKIIIKDWGHPFNPLLHVPRAVPPASRLIEKTADSFGGYGIYLYMRLMDGVEYQRVNDENILTLTKYA